MMIFQIFNQVSSAIDQYFGLDFYTETKCVESEEEEVTKSTEHFLQYNCYIDKDVKYLHTGLMNVSCPVKNEVGLYLIIKSFSRGCKSPSPRPPRRSTARRST